MASPTTDRRLGLAGNTAYKVPATVVATTNVTQSGEQTIDGVALLSRNAANRPDRVLCIAQTDATKNGLWDVSTASWTRSIDANGNYDLVNGTQVQISRGTTNARSVYLLTTADPITVGTTAQTWVASPAVGFLAALAAAAGALLVGFIHSLAGAIATNLLARGRLEVWSADFGHSPTASAAVNDAALLAAITAVYNAGGGTIRIAPGVYQHISVVFNWAAAITVNIAGAGQKAVYFQKSGVTTTPVLDFSVNIGVLDVYSTISDLTIIGNATKLHHGLRATRLASITTRNLGIQAVDTGFESVGCLVALHERPEWQSSNTGFRSRKSTAGGNIYCNLVSFKGGSIRGNTTFGVDLGDAAAVTWDGTKIDLNGTAGNTATGGVMIRDTCDDENGFSNAAFWNSYLENNLGRSFQTENCTGLDLTCENTTVLSPEANRSMNIGAVHTIRLKNCQAPSAGDTVVIGAAVGSDIGGGTINTLTDTSTRQTRQPYTSSGGLNRDSVTSFTVNAGGLRIDGTTPVKNNLGTFTQGDVIVQFQDGAAAGNTFSIYASNGANGNVAATHVRTGTNGVTGRSINSGGTINASGADYAEYMLKADGCGVIPKGAIVGINADGLLTDKWAQSISFVPKSTKPSYVGGDDWFTEVLPLLVLPDPPIRPEPVVPTPGEREAIKKSEVAAAAWDARRAAFRASMEEFHQALRAHESEVVRLRSEHEAARIALEQRHEAARQRVDRIAFAGQVPVNVYGAKPGDYIVPVQDGAGIAGIAIKSPTFDQYRQSVGRVVAIEEDGRARIIVKVS